MREKVGLKLNFQRTKIMASVPITSRQIEGEKVEAVTDFIFLGSKITADSDCSHAIKRCLLLGRKVMTNLDSMLKSKDITLPTRVHLLKAMVFLVSLTQVSHGAFFPPVTHLVSSALMCQERCLPPRVTQNVPTHVSRQALPQPYIRCKPCSIHASD